MRHILPKLSFIAVLALALASCDGGDGGDGTEVDAGDTVDAVDADESFTYELLIRVSGNPNMELAIGGEALVKIDEGELSFTYTREFANAEEAGNALAVDVDVDGSSIGSILTYPDQCLSECESLDRALRTVCISETGERVGLCGQLQCIYQGERCGGYVE